MRNIFRLVQIIPAVIATIPVAHGAVFQTGNFITTPEFSNGFEGIGVDPFPDNTGNTYSEGGITVSYIGTIIPDARLIHTPASPGIWTTWTQAIGGSGNYGWYGPGTGYTAIKLTSGAEMQSIQFLIGSGWGLQTSYLEYELRNGGTLVGSGVVPVGTGNLSTAGWANGEVNHDGSMAYMGFTGGGFDEVWLQNQGGPASNFDPNAFEAAAIDNISATSVPEPQSVAHVAFGLALLGVLRRWARK